MNINKPIIITIVLLTVLCGCATNNGNTDILSFEQAIEQSSKDIINRLPRGARVAIVAFSSEHVNLSEYFMDELTGALVESNLEVADRRNLAFVYRELDLQYSGEVSDETAVSIGKFLGAQYVIFGQLVPTGNSARYRTSSINVETAIQETSTRLTVRNDRGFRNFVSAISRNPITNAVADYGRQSIVSGSAGAFLDRGILHAIRGDYELAIAEFSEAIDHDNNLAAAWLLRGRAYSASVSDISDILEDFRDFVALVPSSGITQLQRAGYIRAITDFTEVIRLDSNLAPAYRDRGVAYNSYSGEHDKAIEDFNMAIRLNPNDPVAYRERGNVYRLKGDEERAMADYNRAISVDPNHAWAYSNRGNGFITRGEYDRAIADYNQAIRLVSNNAVFYSNRGIAYLNKNDYSRALSDYNQAIRLDPNYGNAYNGRGFVYLNRNEYDRAIADFNNAIRLNESNIGAYFNRALAYYNKGDMNRAITDWEMVLRLDPNENGARNNLEIARRQRGW
jgi:tetratricopeptide (TPR) repeat protein